MLSARPLSPIMMLSLPATAIFRPLPDAIAAIEGENIRQVTLVVIDEDRSGDWGIGVKVSGTNDASLSCKPKGHWGIDEGDSLA